MDSAVYSSEVMELFMGGQHEEEWPAWFYRDLAGTLQGPFDAPAMVKWYQDGALPGELLVCGVKQMGMGTKAPGPSAFRPLHALLSDVARGRPYNPVPGSALTGANSMQELAQGAQRRGRQQQQQQQAGGRQPSKQQQKNGGGPRDVLAPGDQRAAAKQPVPPATPSPVAPVPLPSSEASEESSNGGSSGSGASGPEPGSPEWVQALERLLSGGASGGGELKWRAILPSGDRVGPYSAQQVSSWLLKGEAPKGIPGAQGKGGGRGGKQGGAPVQPPNPEELLLCGLLASDYNAQRLPGLKFYKPLAALVALVARGSQYEAVTKHDIARGYPKQGWNEPGAAKAAPAAAGARPGPARPPPPPLPASLAGKRGGSDAPAGRAGKGGGGPVQQPKGVSLPKKPSQRGVQRGANAGGGRPMDVGGTRDSSGGMAAGAGATQQQQGASGLPPHMQLQANMVRMQMGGGAEGSQGAGAFPGMDLGRPGPISAGRLGQNGAPAGAGPSFSQHALPPAAGGMHLGSMMGGHGGAVANPQLAQWVSQMALAGGGYQWPGAMPLTAAGAGPAGHAAVMSHQPAAAAAAAAAMMSPASVFGQQMLGAAAGMPPGSAALLAPQRLPGRLSNDGGFGGVGGGLTGSMAPSSGPLSPAMMLGNPGAAGMVGPAVALFGGGAQQQAGGQWWVLRGDQFVQGPFTGVAMLQLYLHGALPHDCLVCCAPPQHLPGQPPAPPPKQAFAPLAALLAGAGPSPGGQSRGELGRGQQGRQDRQDGMQQQQQQRQQQQLLQSHQGRQSESGNSEAPQTPGPLPAAGAADCNALLYAQQLGAAAARAGPAGTFGAPAAAAPLGGPLAGSPALLELAQYTFSGGGLPAPLSPVWFVLRALDGGVEGPMEPHDIIGAVARGAVTGVTRVCAVPRAQAAAGPPPPAGFQEVGALLAFAHAQRAAAMGAAAATAAAPPVSWQMGMQIGGGAGAMAAGGEPAFSGPGSMHPGLMGFGSHASPGGPLAFGSADASAAAAAAAQVMAARQMAGMGLPQMPSGLGLGAMGGMGGPGGLPLQAPLMNSQQGAPEDGGLDHRQDAVAAAPISAPLPMGTAGEGMPA